MYLKYITTLACLCTLLSITLPDVGHACRDYDGHHNSNVAPSCGGAQAGSVDAAIDAVGLPAAFHVIAWRESGDDPYAVNPISGACGPFQFLPSTAAAYGYTCFDLTDPYTAALAALELYEDYGFSPWVATY